MRVRVLVNITEKMLHSEGTNLVLIPMNSIGYCDDQAFPVCNHILVTFDSPVCLPEALIPRQHLRKAQ